MGLSFFSLSHRRDKHGSQQIFDTRLSWSSACYVHGWWGQDRWIGGGRSSRYILGCFLAELLLLLSVHYTPQWASINILYGPFGGPVLNVWSACGLWIGLRRIYPARKREDYKEKGLVFWKTSKEPATLTSTDLLCWTRTIDRTRRLIKRTLFFFFFVRKNNMDKK